MWLGRFADRYVLLSVYCAVMRTVDAVYGLLRERECGRDVAGCCRCDLVGAFGELSVFAGSCLCVESVVVGLVCESGCG